MVPFLTACRVKGGCYYWFNNEAFDLFTKPLEYGDGLLVQLAAERAASEVGHHDQEGPSSCSTHPRDFQLHGAYQRTWATFSACVVGVVHPVCFGPC